MEMEVKPANLAVILVATASFVVVVAGMRAAAALINPFLLAVFLAILFSPPLYWLQRRGVPNALAVAIILCGFLVTSLLLMAFVGRSLNALTGQLPVYQERLATLMAHLFAWLNEPGDRYVQRVVSRLCQPQKSHGPGLLHAVPGQGPVYAHVSGLSHRPVHPDRGGGVSREAAGRFS